MREVLWAVVGAVFLLMALSSAVDAASWKVEKLPGEYKFTEGPVWTPWGTLLFSDCEANQIWEMSFSVAGGISNPARTGASGKVTRKVYRDPAGPSNGLTFDPQGRLVFCDYGSRRIVRIEKDGKVTVLADSYEGKKFNSPNDIVVKSDGSVYFTDPPYGVKPEDRELDFQGVFRIRPDGRVDLLVKDFDKPNGLCFSKDESKLYIADSSNRLHIRVFTVANDGTLSGGKVFARVSSKQKGCPDGMKMGQDGNLYSSGPGGVWIIDTSGKHLETIPVPQIPSNLAWGDKDGKTLYITARTGVYRARRD